MAIAYGMVILVVYERSAHQDAFTRIEGLTVLVGGFPRNPELPHLGDQGCPHWPESGCRAIASANRPIRLTQGRNDVRSFRVRQGAHAWNRQAFVDART
jgi:hypothetical protein